jgi:hypothetical protein
MKMLKLSRHIWFSLCFLAITEVGKATQYSVEWQNLTNAEYNQYGLYSVGASGWNTSGAFSTNFLSSNESGEIEFSYIPNMASIIIGLSNSNPDENWYTIKYGIMFGIFQTTVYYRGSPVLTLPPSSSADIYKISKDLNGQVRYYKNGLLLGTYSTIENGTLFVDCSFYDPGTLTNLKVSFKSGYRVQWKSFENSYFDQNNVSLFSNQPNPGFGISGAHS